MGWIKITGKVIEFTGKLVQAEGFEEWAVGKGKEVVEKVILQRSGWLFKASRAKKSIWDDLTGKFRNGSTFDAAVRDFVKSYYTRVYNLASKPSKLGGELPAKSSITVLPRSVLNAWERFCWQNQFEKSAELANLKGGRLLRSFFFDEMVRQLDAAFSEAASKSSPDEPLPVGVYWVIGFDGEYQWLDSKGHYYVFTSWQIAHADDKKTKKELKQEAATALELVKKWLFTLTVEERQALSQKLPLPGRAMAA